ncbi:hypothetical protein ACNKHO_13970 [Shigella flexneri]
MRRTGKPLSFELLLPSAQESVGLPFSTLARLGITLNMRKVDMAQLTNRKRSRDTT